MFEFKMPSMGADMENGILVQWNYAVGDRVEKGDIICEIETAKGDIDVEIWESGVITAILAEPGQKVPVGEVMARLESGVEAGEGSAGHGPSIEVAAEQPEPEEPEEPAAPEALEALEALEEPTESEPETPAPSTVINPTKAEPPAAAAASPAARRRARELGVSLDEISGSGPGGIVKLDDVERATVKPHHHRVTPVARKMAEAAGVDPDLLPATGPHDTVIKADVERELARRPSSHPAEEKPEPYAALRGAIAKAMSKSKREIPHYYLRTTIDVSGALQWMERRNADRSITERLVFGVLVARAVALAAGDVPEVNGFYENESFRPSERVHLGFAIAMRGGGVVAPAIHDLDHKTLDETMGAVKDLVRRVRGGKLRSSEMTDPTITLTALGDSGVDTVFGVIYPPQVAIVGFGTPREIPFAKDGMVGVHTCADVTLSGDHRVSDGLSGAKFLQRIHHYLTTPEEL